MCENRRIKKQEDDEVVVTQNKILHLTFSPQGGAGRAAISLAQAQRDEGIQAEVMFASMSGLRAAPLSLPKTTIAAVADEHLLKRRLARQQLSILRSRHSFRLDFKWISDNFNIVHLHWIEGMISRVQIAELSKMGLKIIWTLHDMRPLTGGCHHSGSCDGYKKECSLCPMLRRFASKMAETSLREELSSLTNLNIQFIAPSPWIREIALASKIGSEGEVHLIPNVINNEFLERPLSSETRTGDILFIAKDLGDPNKRFEQVATWAEHFAINSKVLAIGDNSRHLKGWKNVNFLGSLSPSDIVSEMDRASFLLVNSEEETAPLVISEASCRGLIPLVPSYLENRVVPEVAAAGCLFFDSLKDLESIIQDVTFLTELSTKRDILRATALQVHGPGRIAQTHNSIYFDL